MGLPDPIRSQKDLQGGARRRSAVGGRRSAVSGQWSVVSGQWSVVSGQRSAVSGQKSEGTLQGMGLISDR